MEDSIIGKISRTIEEKSGLELALPEVSEVVESNQLVVTKENLPSVVKTFKEQVGCNLHLDYNFARKNLSDMITKGMTAVDGAISLARESESPRVYEATATFLKTLSDLNKDLLELSKINTEKSTENGQPVTVNNNSVFVGSSEDLASMIQSRIRGSILNQLPTTPNQVEPE